MHKKNPYCEIIKANGHDFVEIGGVKWATCNLGAEKPWEFGLYFQWGGTKGYTASQVGSDYGKKYFTWTDYNTSSQDGPGMTKYNSSDGKTVLDASDDAVTANWGGGWRMPTMEEYVALGAAVNTDWTEDYQGSGIAGRICTNKTDSSKVLFFPAVGFCGGGGVSYVGSEGYYWSSSLNTNSDVIGYCLNFFSDRYVGWKDYYYRYLGFPVRGVLYC